VTDAALIRSDEPSQQTPEVQSIAREAARILTSNEQILYVAVQNLLALSPRPDAILATNNRLIYFRRHILGRIDIEDFQWQDVKDVSISVGMMASDVVVHTTDGASSKMGLLEKEQAQHLYAVAQQMEQEWREKRRVRSMEEERARAGGIMMTIPSMEAAGTASQPVESQVDRLAKAKAMLDKGLISEAEYDTLKAKILATV
jgi:hypothetical protein